MIINKTGIALCILATFALSGCGSDSTSTALAPPPDTALPETSDPNPTPPETTDPDTTDPDPTPPDTTDPVPPEVIPPGKDKIITVIDGYLKNAEICADKNGNFLCDPGESLGKTGEGGKFTLSAKYAPYPLLAKIKANQTQDSDKVGEVIRSYTMMAQAGQDFITPFSTLAVTEKSSLEDIANYLNLDPASVSGDYVSMKEGNVDAFKAHIYARAMTGSLEDTDATGIQSLLKKTANVITEEEGKGNLKQLDNIRFGLDALGYLTRYTLFDNLDKYLTGESVWVNESLNFTVNQFEGKTSNTFSNGKLTRAGYLTGYNETISDYTIDNNLLTYTNTSLSASGTETDTFIYLSEELALSVGSNYQDLKYWMSKGIAGYPIPSDLFSGKTWYELYDVAKGTAIPEPLIREYYFAADKTGTVTADSVTKKMTWSVNLSDLTIKYEGEILSTSFGLRTPPETSNGVIILKNINPRLMINSKEQLDSILYYWNKAKTNNALNK